jgi:hypothetical protein
VQVFCVQIFARTARGVNRTEIGSREAHVFAEETWRFRITHLGVATIAPFMLAPCSASSMLCASLRPGQRPGLRALTTPPRGTCWLLRDGDKHDGASHGSMIQVLIPVVVDSV